MREADVVAALQAALVDAPPAGVSRDQILGFFRRFEPALVGMVAKALRNILGASLAEHHSNWQTVRASLMRARRLHPESDASQALTDILKAMTRKGMAEVHPGSGRRSADVETDERAVARQWVRVQRESLLSLAHEIWALPHEGETREPAIKLTRTVSPSLSGQISLPKGSVWRVLGESRAGSFFYGWELRPFLNGSIYIVPRDAAELVNVQASYMSSLTKSGNFDDHVGNHWTKADCGCKH